MENKFMGLSIFIGILVLLVLASIANSDQALKCKETMFKLVPCSPFLTGPPLSPNPYCCSALAKVNAAANTTQLRRELCECFKKAVPSYGVKPDKAKKLPKLCRVHLSVPLIPTVDCKSIP